ncbi:MAG: branched-chain amino acid ABC transporter permease [Deltaproteobacteria bacterium]|nr:branched-chain amino acid ABC transporter permease [Deltaproteobacteria bacterium]
MEKTYSPISPDQSTGRGRIRRWFSGIPVLGWIFGALVAVVLEYYLGDALSEVLGLEKVPALFGVTLILKKPLLLPKCLMFVGLIYVIPISVVAKYLSPLTNRIAGKLIQYPYGVSAVLHLALLYAVFYIWSDVSAYRLLTLKLSLIAVMITLSLNVVNGYMGEFSCSHPGFLALGAYGASVITVLFFVKDKLFGAPLLPPAIGPYLYPVALVLGGLLASVGALVIAVPSFRTRGDYLAIISLAFMFIVKSLIENLEIVGGPRGLSSQPGWSSLLTVFIWTVLCVWIINNFVRSTLGKAANAVRDDESAADAMTVNTRRTKVVTFMFAAFWAGVAGGLYAHVIRYANPGDFGIQKLADVLAMVYLGGLNSVVGSIVGAVGMSILGEALRPLGIYKWIIIPLLLILVMIFRPTGLIAFREFDVREILKPKRRM